VFLAASFPEPEIKGTRRKTVRIDQALQLSKCASIGFNREDAPLRAHARRRERSVIANIRPDVYHCHVGGKEPGNKPTFLLLKSAKIN